MTEKELERILKELEETEKGSFDSEYAEDINDVEIEETAGEIGATEKDVEDGKEELIEKEPQEVKETTNSCGEGTMYFDGAILRAFAGIKRKQNVPYAEVIQIKKEGEKTSFTWTDEHLLIKYTMGPPKNYEGLREMVEMGSLDSDTILFPLEMVNLFPKGDFRCVIGKQNGQLKVAYIKVYPLVPPPVVLDIVERDCTYPNVEGIIEEIEEGEVYNKPYEVNFNIIHTITEFIRKVTSKQRLPFLTLSAVESSGRLLISVEGHIVGDLEGDIQAIFVGNKV